MSVQEVQLFADGMSSEDLLACANEHGLLADELARKCDLVARWHQECTVTAERQRLWHEYEHMCRDYSVLVSWYNVLYSAYVFSVHGYELTTTSRNGLREELALRKS